jgi:chromate transport protein ChrA
VLMTGMLMHKLTLYIFNHVLFELPKFWVHRVEMKLMWSYLKKLLGKFVRAMTVATNIVVICLVYEHYVN